MKYFLDTEFMEDGKTIEMLSIGIVAEDGRELYRENAEADVDHANDWVRENVLPYLEGPSATEDRYMSRAAIRDAIVDFVGEDEKPEFWAYYADYDWVLLCQLFGRMVDLPKGWPFWCRDLRQYLEHHGNAEIKKRDEGRHLWYIYPFGEFRIPGFRKHHALWDARWVKLAYLTIEKGKDK